MFVLPRAPFCAAVGRSLVRTAFDGGKDDGLAAVILPEPCADLQNVGAREGVLRGTGGEGVVDAGLRLPGGGGEQ